MAEVAAPAVLVVIPCYNGGQYLPGLIESLAAQTFGPLAIILVDDGSTDPAIESAIAALPAHYTVVRQVNIGLAAARNAGFAAARLPLVSVNPTGSLRPSGVAPIMTKMHCFSSLNRACS
jgi:glycosyltransferase involved in cell wall biosynthesis